jgi:hypothetical protein
MQIVLPMSVGIRAMKQLRPPVPIYTMRKSLMQIYLVRFGSCAKAMMSEKWKHP